MSAPEVVLTTEGCAMPLTLTSEQWETLLATLDDARDYAPDVEALYTALTEWSYGMQS